MEAVPPGEEAGGVQFANLAIEDLVLVGEGRRKAPGMRLGQVRHHLGEQLEPDQEAVERIVVEFVAAAEEIVKEFAVTFEVAEDQRLGEVRLVLEVIEEPALRDPGSGDKLVDRGRGESLREHRQLGEVEESVAGRATLSDRHVEHRRTILRVRKASCDGGHIDRVDVGLST